MKKAKVRKNKAQKKKSVNKKIAKVNNMKKENKKMAKAKRKNKKWAENKSAQKKKEDIEKIDLDSEVVIGFSKENDNININAKKQKKVKNKKKKRILTENQIKRRKMLLKFVRWTGLIAILGAAIIFIILSPIFDIKHVDVKDNDIISFEKIISLSGIELNNNMFKYNKMELEKNIKRNAYIEEVKIDRILPDTIKITVKERTPTLMLLYGNSYVYINNQGYILEISDKLLNLPIIENYETNQNDLVEGNRICINDLEKLNMVLKILEISESEGLKDKITAIDIQDENDYKVIMYGEEKTIHLGDGSSLEERMLWITSMIEKLKGQVGDIFINMNLNYEKPYFRKRV